MMNILMMFISQALIQDKLYSQLILKIQKINGNVIMKKLLTMEEKFINGFVILNSMFISLVKSNTLMNSNPLLPQIEQFLILQMLLFKEMLQLVTVVKTPQMYHHLYSSVLTFYVLIMMPMENLTLSMITNSLKMVLLLDGSFLMVLTPLLNKLKENKSSMLLIELIQLNSKTSSYNLFHYTQVLSFLRFITGNNQPILLLVTLKMTQLIYYYIKLNHMLPLIN